MKPRHWISAGFAIAAIASFPLLGEGTPPDAGALAVQQDNEERFRRLEGTVEGLLRAQELLQKRMLSMADEIAQIRLEMAKGKAENVRREEFTKVWDKIQEIEQKREADQKLVLNALDDIRKVVKTAAAPRPVEPADDKAPAYEYTIQPGDNISRIIQAYNDEFKKRGLPLITQKQVEQANPKLNPDLVVPGQKIRIPVPSK